MVLVGSVSDMKENSLKQESYWSFIEKTMPLAMYRSSGDIRRKILFCNQHFISLFGLEEDLKSGFQSTQLVSLQNLLWPEDKETVDFRIHEAIRYKKSYHNECRFTKKDGSIVWVIDKGDIELDENGKVLCLNGFLQDITYLKSVSTGQLAEDEWFLQTIKNCSDGIWDWTTVTNSPKISGKFKKLLGYEEDDPIGESVEWFLENVHPEDFGPFSQAMTHYIDRPEGEFNFEIRIMTRHKHYATCVLKGLSQTDAQGRVFRIAGQVVDITSHRTLQYELEEMRNETLKISEAKSKFIATLNHDLRGPLTGIMGLTGLLKEKVLDHTAHKNLCIIEDTAGMLLNLVNDILDVSKIEAGKLEIEEKPGLLRSCVSKLIETVRAQAEEKELSLNLMYDPKIPKSLNFDEKRLQQVLLNLLTNAIKFTNLGYVNITVSFMHESYDTVDVRFEVKDTGCGISEELRDYLFDDFTQGNSSTTGRKNSGTGLGLSICKRLVSLMGGSIQFSSEEAKGSTFWFVLSFKKVQEVTNASEKEVLKVAAIEPVEDDETPNQQKPTQFFEKNCKGLKILLAEDNYINQEVMKGLLSKLGHQLIIAENGQEAVDIFEKDEFDLVLMDINMPIMDGIEATRLLRKTTKGKEVPILAITANTLESECNACLQAGVNQVIHKPVDKSILQDLLAPYTPKEQETSKLSPSLKTEHQEQHQPETQTDEVPLICYETLLTLKEDLGSEKVQKLMNIYKRDTRLVLDKMQEASSQEVHNLAHNLAGMSENLGITKMAFYARALMALSLKESVYLPTRVKELYKTLADVEDAIESFSKTQLMG